MSDSSPDPKAAPKPRSPKKRWRRVLLYVTGALSLAGAAVCVPTLWGTPWKVEHLYMRTFGGFALRNPELLSQMRLLEPMGLSFHNDDLNDRSIEAELENFEFLAETLDTLESYEREDLDDKLSYDVFHWFLADQLQGRKFAHYDYPVNQLFGVQSELPDFMVNTHAVDDLEGAHDYVTRVAKMGTAFDQVLAGLDHRESLGIIPPRFVMTRVLEQMRAFVDVRPSEHLLYTHLASKLEALKPDDKTRKEILAELELAIQDELFPAYAKLIAWFEAREPNASSQDGVWKFPEGAAFYAWKVRSFTTTDLTPEQVHALGLAQVAVIQSQMKVILREQGYDTQDFAATMQTLNKEARFLYPDSEQGRAQILADYQRIIDDIDANMGDLFSARPKAKVQVERVPEFKQATAPGAYYNAPPFDGSKPGTFYANLRSVEEIPKFGMRTLAYHEAIPGHHYQIARAQELTDLPFFRRVVPFTAYAEGWALYAEQVAAENGFQDDPFDHLGYLTAQLFRANRLVVDTGIHAKRWTREQAIDYMLANTGMPKSDVVAEIERYIVLPGQALAYMVGRLEILRLRDKAQAELKEAFVLAEFHEAVLGQGPLPLALLAEVVDSYIATKRAA